MNMNTSIIRLMYAFIGLFLVVSLVMVNVQVFDGSWVVPKGLQAQSGYDPRLRFASEQPIRGSIFDRNGVKLVWSVRDDNAPCGWRREWNPDAVSAGLAPLIGYFNCNYGASGVEAAYNAILTGSTGQNDQSQSARQTATNIYNHLLHKQVQGSDIYLTIDLKLQEQANAAYEPISGGGGAETGGVCQPVGSNPPGSVTVENPQTGEILAMLSRPYYDPNRIDDPTYWQQINSDQSGQPLLNRAAQGLYVPGSSFKTVTLAAALDTGKTSLDAPYTKAQYFDFVVDGHNFHWDDSFAGSPDPMTVRQGYAFSVNPIFARVAVDTGQDTWLNYVERFGIAVPGANVPQVPFDAPSAQSSAYPPGAPLDPVTFAASGFGQGDLEITPLTMTEVASAIGFNGQLVDPYVVAKVVAPNGDVTQTHPQPELYSGGQQPVVQPQTAALVRQAMREVVTYGTAFQGQAVHIADSPAMEGGKTGTGQVGDGQLPQTWWISMAPAVNQSGQADVNTTANLTVVVMKEHSGEGACQIFVGDDLYKCAAADNDWTPPAALGACPVGLKPQG